MPFVIHFVVNDSENLNQLENDLMSQMISILGYNVAISSAINLGEDALIHADTLLISPFVKGESVASFIKSTRIPVVNGSRILASQIGYADGSKALSGIELSMEEGTHPILSSFSDSIDIFNSDTDFGFLIGLIEDATVIARFQNNPCVVSIPKGSIMKDGSELESEIIGLHIFHGFKVGTANWLDLLSYSLEYSTSKSDRLPEGWKAEKIGIHGNCQQIVSFTETGKITSCGRNIGKDSDGFTFLYQELTGDFSLSFRLDSFQGVEPIAKAGIMFRKSLSPSSSNIGLYLTRDQEQEIRLNIRQGDGNRAQSVRSEVSSQFKWLKLEKKEDNFTAYFSDDGLDWENLLGERTFEVDLGVSYYLGIAVSANTISSPATAYFSNVEIKKREKALPLKWTFQNIGNPGDFEGKVFYNDEQEEFNVSSFGEQIKGVEDSFTYIYKEVRGDWELEARVSKLYAQEAPDAKVGIMFRSSLEPGAPHFGIFLLEGEDSESRITYRNVGNNRSPNIQNTQFSSFDTAPVWLRITKKGSVFKGYLSEDGLIWNEVSNNSVITIDFPDSYFAGLALASGNPNEEAIASINSVSFKEIEDDGGDIKPEPRGCSKVSDKYEYTPIIPGVYTYGMNMNPSGRNGEKVHVIKVTNLDGNVKNLKEGSFPWAVNRARNFDDAHSKIIVFETSGEIKLSDELKLQGLTKTRISGQTCYGSGIYVYDAQVRIVACDELLIEHITFAVATRRFDGREKSAEWDTISIQKDNKRICLKNCTLMFSLDEVMGTANSIFLRLTLVNCILANGLYRTNHPNVVDGESKGHSKGALMRPEDSPYARVAFINTIFLNNHERNPLTSISYIMVNYLGYNAGTKFIDIGETRQYKFPEGHIDKGKTIPAEDLKVSIYSAYFKEGKNFNDFKGSKDVKPIFFQPKLNKGRDKIYINPDLGPNGAIFYESFSEQDHKMEKLVKTKKNNLSKEDEQDWKLRLISNQPEFYNEGHVDPDTLTILKGKEIPVFVGQNAGAFANAGSIPSDIELNENSYQVGLKRAVNKGIDDGDLKLYDKAPNLTFKTINGMREGMPTGSDAHKIPDGERYTRFELWLQSIDPAETHFCSDESD